jgi:hypothetical protein
VLVVDRHGGVGDIVVGSDSAKVGSLENTRGSVVPNETTLLEKDSGRVDKIGTLLDKSGVSFEVVGSDVV